MSARDMYRGKSNVASFDQTGLTVFLRVGVRNRSRSTVTTTNLRGFSQQYRNRRRTFDNVRPAQTNDRRVAAVHGSSSDVRPIHNKRQTNEDTHGSLTPPLSFANRSWHDNICTLNNTTGCSSGRGANAFLPLPRPEYTGRGSLAAVLIALPIGFNALFGCRTIRTLVPRSRRSRRSRRVRQRVRRRCQRIRKEAKGRGRKRKNARQEVSG